MMSFLSQRGQDKEISGSFNISCLNERIPGEGRQKLYL